MSGQQQVELVILLLVAVLALTSVARGLLVPYPILLVIGGLGLALAPGLPRIELAPDLVFLVFLPPVLWAAAYFTSLRDFKANLRPITLLAVGLVLATTGAVAAVARALLPGLGWAAAIALGAIVSPPDAVAATAIARRLRIPHRVVTVLEGESLVNDASALILYRAAVAAASTGTFVLGGTLVEFVVAAVGGVLIGVAVGALVEWGLRLVDDSLTEIAITLLAPYIAWVLATRADVSAVLACVAGGFYVRRRFSAIVGPATRIQARAVWELVVFILNGVMFILIGLQLGALREAIAPGELRSLVLYGALISTTCVLVRLVWVPLAAWLPRALSPSLRARDPLPPASTIFLVAWTGMRGIVSLAAALALPRTTASGAPFPFREEIVLIAFAVILSTLVVQGLSLAPLIRALHLPADGKLAEEEAYAREHAATVALARLDELAREPWAHASQVERLRVRYGGALRRFSRLTPTDSIAAAEEAAAARRLRHETLSAERAALIKLRDDGVISDDVLLRLEQELDVEALRIGAGEARTSGAHA